jgi:hypothetical protein
MRGQWNTENASVISADDASEPTAAITERRPGGDEVLWQRVHAESTPPRLVVLDLSAAPRVDRQSAEALGQYGVRNCCQRYPVLGSRTTVLGPRPTSQRRGGLQTWRCKPFHDRG